MIADVPLRRVVMLGASNLTLSAPTVIATACEIWREPLDILGAYGHGRSYGLQSFVLGRSLPSIVGCGLWNALAKRPTAPTTALVTDIGNDILYGTTVAQIVEWVESCVNQLQRQKARIVMTSLPAESLAGVGSWRFLLMRTLLFPASRLRLETALERVRELNDQLRELSKSRGIVFVEQESEWYGFDPIHIRRAQQPRAWSEILSGWSQPSQSVDPARISLARTLYLISRRPERRRLFGISQCHRQPAGRLGDGTTVAIF